MNLSEWERILLEATEEVQERVAEVSRKGARGRSTGVGASGDKTLVADREAEEVLLSAIGGLGEVRVLSEEAGTIGGGDGGALAVVDPLDGSSNYERGIPFYCTSVALVEGTSLDDVTFGIVRDLVSGDVYVAKRGKGTTKNGTRVHPSGVSEAAEAVVGVDVSRSPASLVRRLGPLMSGVKRQVHFGANALELCYVSDGRLDGFVDVRGLIRITDFAAAFLIASEAGAEVTAPEGGKLAPRFDLDHRFGFVASANRDLHGGLLGLARAGEGRGRGP